MSTFYDCKRGEHKDCTCPFYCGCFCHDEEKMMPLRKMEDMCAVCGTNWGRHSGDACPKGGTTFVEAKLKQSTVVNGVTLTRKQIEDALADLNKPEPPPPYIPKVGDVFTVNGKYNGNRFLALSPKTWRYAFSTSTEPAGVMAVQIGQPESIAMDFVPAYNLFTKVNL